MAMVNPMNPILANPNAKDSRWLTLEVCREYQRNKCTRTENECKFAHPPAHVEVQNGRVIACFDSIKGKCQRKDPPCKYLHPPQHLREQLLQNGRNNLILKSLQLQALQQHVIPGIIPMAPHYFSTVPTSGVPQFNPLIGGSVPTVTVPGGTDGTMVTQQIPGVVSTQMSAKAQTRPDRLERVSDSHSEAGTEPSLSDHFFLNSHQVCREFQRGTCSRQTSDCRYAHPTENVTVDSADNHVTVCMDFIKNKCTRDSCRYFHPPAHLQSQIKAAQQRANASVSSAPSTTLGPQLGLTMPPYKRVAMADGSLGKGGIPMYQPTLGTAYHQAALMQLQQQPYIPVTYCPTEMISSHYTNYLPSVAGHAPTVPRF